VEKPTAYFGLQQLERNKGIKEKYMFFYTDIYYVEPKDFTDTFRDFCFASLFIKEEVIKALQQLRVKCNQILEMSIFNYSIEEPMYLDQFKHIQESATSQLLYYLKGNWIEQMIKTIYTQFQDVGKGWFNMKETSKITYDFGKLKRFLTLIRLMMQDTIQALVRSNYQKFKDLIFSRVPDQVEISSPNSIVNFFDADLEVPVEDRPHRPSIFLIDLLKSNVEESFIYSTRNTQSFITNIL